MKTIYLIPCASKKCDHRAKARDLYQSALFKKSLAYSEKQKPDAIYVISDLHGLLSLEKEIEPYEKDLKKMSAAENREWAEMVLKDLAKVADLDNDKFVLLVGKTYRKNIVSKIKHYEIPMEGLKIGKQLQWLSKRL